MGGGVGVWVCVCVSGVGVLGTGTQLCDLCVTVPARLCSGVSGFLLTPVSLRSGLHLATHICCCVHSLLTSGTCLHLCVFVQERGCVCVFAVQDDRGQGRAWRPVHLQAL